MNRLHILDLIANTADIEIVKETDGLLVGPTYICKSQDGFDIMHKTVEDKLSITIPLAKLDVLCSDGLVGDYLNLLQEYVDIRQRNIRSMSVLGILKTYKISKQDLQLIETYLKTV